MTTLSVIVVIKNEYEQTIVPSYNDNPENLRAELVLSFFPETVINVINQLVDYNESANCTGFKTDFKNNYWGYCLKITFNSDLDDFTSILFLDDLKNNDETKKDTELLMDMFSGKILGTSVLSNDMVLHEHEFIIYKDGFLVPIVVNDEVTDLFDFNKKGA